MNFTNKGSSGPQREELSFLSVCLLFGKDSSLPCLGAELAGQKAALSLKGCVITLAWPSKQEVFAKGSVGSPEPVRQLWQFQRPFVVRWSNDPSDFSPLKALVTFFQSFKFGVGKGYGGAANQLPTIPWRSPRLCQIGLLADL